MLTEILEYRWGSSAARRRCGCVVAVLVALLAVVAPLGAEEGGETAVAAEAVAAEAGPAAQEAAPLQSEEPAPLPPEAVYDSGHPAARDDGFVIQPESADDFSYLDLIARMGFGLGLVVLLAWGAAVLVRRSGLSRQMGAAGGAVRVVDRTFLAPKKAVYLVNVGGRTLALGVTEAHISRLAEWSEGEVDLQPAEQPGNGAAFRQLFEQVRQRRSEQ